MSTGKQLKLIWVLARQAGLDSESLHAEVKTITGKPSIKTLNNAEVKEVMQRLLSKGVKPKRKRTVRNHPVKKVVQLVTPGQLKLIAHLERELDWQDNSTRLESFVMRVIHKSRIRTMIEAQKVIEGLKNMVVRKGTREAKNG